MVQAQTQYEFIYDYIDHWLTKEKFNVDPRQEKATNQDSAMVPK